MMASAASTFMVVMTSAASTLMIAAVVMATSATAHGLKLLGSGIAHLHDFAIVFHCKSGEGMIEIHLDFRAYLKHTAEHAEALLSHHRKFGTDFHFDPEIFMHSKRWATPVSERFSSRAPTSYMTSTAAMAVRRSW